MKNFLVFFIFFYLFLNNFSYANTTIATLNLDLIYKNTLAYNNFIEELDLYKNDLQINIKKQENLIIEKKNEIESLKLISTEDIILTASNNYNRLVEILMSDIDLINSNISLNLETNQSTIKGFIVSIAQKIAETNKIDVILTQNQYFISSSSIDISDEIINNLNNSKIDLKIIKLNK